MKNNIVILGGKGHSVRMMYNELKNNFFIERVILESPPNKIKFIKNRIKKFGYTKVLGQILFSLFTVRILNILYRNRKKEILKNFNLSLSKIPKEKVVYVNSVNSDHSIEQINSCRSKYLIVCGTRIISRKTLNSIEKSFINIHAGITPKYRGVHGAYWALINNDMDSCGVTVHFVDKGVDTGKIIAQSTIKISKNDSFVTYPLIQFAVGLSLLKKILFDFFNGIERNKFISSNNESYQYYHPTIWYYFYAFFKHKVK